jgi:hypothetical protein
MTIVNQSAKRTVQGNGAQTVFDYNFLIPTASAAELYFSDEETGNSYLLSPASWSLSGANNPLGGTFTYPRDTSQAPLKSTQRLTLRRIVPNTQNTALNNQSGYTPRAVEGGLDWAVMQVQQLAAEQGNALRLWPANEAIPPLPFLSAADRANTIIGFDGDGDPMIVLGAVGQALVSPFGGTLIAAPSPSAARGLLEIAPTWGGAAGGTANAPTISLNPPITAYAAGQAFEFISNAAANTGAVTLSVNGLGAVAINKGDGTVPLVAGDIPASHVIVVQYDGTRFRLTSPVPYALVDASVTTGKIADAAVTTAKLAVAAVTTEKLAANIGTPVVLATAVASASASLDITGVFSDAYDRYELELLNLLPAVNDGTMILRIGTGVGPTWQSGSSYNNAIFGITDSSSGIPASLTTAIYLSWPGGGGAGVSNVAATGGVSGRVSFCNPEVATVYPSFDVETRHIYSTGPRASSIRGSGVYVGAAAITGLRVLSSLGNITSGLVRLLGYRK